MMYSSALSTLIAIAILASHRVSGSPVIYSDVTIVVDADSFRPSINGPKLSSSLLPSPLVEMHNAPPILKIINGPAGATGACTDPQVQWIKPALTNARGLAGAAVDVIGGNKALGSPGLGT
ncbi:hypothetical protein OBBRIDRAFT_58816 [Obba rivulosa]|uniref:Uncharacterized protein n=1 Tax=Obba rivulosa TaxID=1052685 RepID=A0A8E2AQ74_9APHY|nr:hypothetical protein OBBRIDRAFT_58816 [Obba rivulosa]